MKALLIILLLPALAAANTLTWQDNSNNEGGFTVEMLQGGAWVEVARVGPGVTTYSDSNTEGVYRVRAYVAVSGQADVFSAYSNTAAKLNAPVNLNIK